MSDLSVDFTGLKLRNPLIAAAGPITSNIENVKRLADSGMAAIITKTGFTRSEYEKWVGRKNIFPYKPVYKYQGLKNGRLLSLPSLADVPVSEMARRVEKMKRLDIPIIGSIMGLSPSGYRESARILASAGVDAIEIDLCCTIPEFTTTYAYAGQNVNFAPAKYARLASVVKEAVHLPVGIKSTVSLYLYGRIMEGLIRSKLKNSLPDFITLVGQLDENPGVNLDTLAPIVSHFPTMGWQGTLSGLTYSALATFSSVLGTGNPCLSASGGIRDHEGVINAMALGATSVQLQTVVLDKGPGAITKILESLRSYLDSHRIGDISSIIGAGSRDLIPSMVLGKFMLERDSLSGKIYAEADRDACTGCGLCVQVFTEDAAAMLDGRVSIDATRCRACNLCVLKCPSQAIILRNAELLEQFIRKYKNLESVRSFREFMKKPRIGIVDKLLIVRHLRQWGLA
ncbi:hypothetical protein EG833_00370 [archaeon]|nr:hypothetical protein [archaeon]